MLPSSYARDPMRRYPVIYEIPGFGGNINGAGSAAVTNRTSVAGTDMLYVILDPSCYWGHHVFADSDNNGPRGQALVEELIPHIERTYRAEGFAGARYVTGHSSGGWSSLWLQTHYPDFFGGVWSTAPDPNRFPRFSCHQPVRPGVNMFYRRKGWQRLRAAAGTAVLFYKPFSDMEVVMGHGRPAPVVRGSWAWALTGRYPGCGIGTPAASMPRSPNRGALRYSLAARAATGRRWTKLKGKLHVYMGGEDTFYLEGATILLKESQAKLGSDAVIEIFPGKDHGTLMTQDLRQRIAREMAATYQKLQKAAAAR